MDPKTEARKNFILRPEQYGEPWRITTDGQFFGQLQFEQIGNDPLAIVVCCRVRGRAGVVYPYVIGWKRSEILPLENGGRYITVAMIPRGARRLTEIRLRPIIGGNIQYFW